MWFPEKGGPTAQAVAICKTCPVQQECLEYALRYDIPHGIWGGMTVPQRQRLKRMSSRKGNKAPALIR